MYLALNLFSELRKGDKARGLPSILSLSRNEFCNANNTGAGMSDSSKSDLIGSRNFRQGGPGQSDKKSSDKVVVFLFFCFFLCVFFVLSLFYRSQMVNFKEIYDFSRFLRGSNIFQGEGPTFSRGDPIAYSL